MIKDKWRLDVKDSAELDRLRKENAALKTRLALQRGLSVRRGLVIQGAAERLQGILKAPDSFDLFAAVYDYCRELEGETKGHTEPTEAPAGNGSAAEVEVGL